MSWISKSLTLDLIAIAIDGMNKAFDRISAEPDAAPGVSPWPVEPAAVVDAPILASAPTPTHEPAAEPAPTPEPAPAPVVDGEKLLAEAQTALRTIAQTEGTDWITTVLFPHFGTNSLNTVPADRLPELIAMATTHQKEAAA